MKSKATPTAPVDAGTRPTSQQIKARRKASGLTQTQAAELLHTKCRTWQQWEVTEGASTHRQMHAAFWELFLLKTKATVAC